MNPKDNYDFRKKEAQKYFLNFDQEALIEKLSLEYDEEYLYTEFVSTPYRICRRSGLVEKSRDGFQTVEEAGFDEVLSVLDCLCHNRGLPKASGRWAPVNSLKNRVKTIGVDGGFYNACSKVFDEFPGDFKEECEAFGGTPVDFGDIGYQIPIFRDLELILKFYHSDEEFEAQTVVLWDENALDYMYYETAFYVMSYILQTIERNILARHGMEPLTYRRGMDAGRKDGN